MVTLTRLLGALVGWATASGRRMLVVLAVPLFAAVVVFGPDPDHDPPPAAALPSGVGGAGQGGGSAAGSGSGTGSTAGSGSRAAGPPTPSTVTIGPSDRPRPEPTLPSGAAATATGYVTTVNSHDARPGGDRDFLDSYRRAKRFVTAQVYALITAPSRRGDFLWTTWVADHARVTVRVDNTAVPDGAPVPTSDTAYVRVHFTQRVAPMTGQPSSTSGEVTMVTQRQRNGRWLVSRLLAGS